MATRIRTRGGVAPAVVPVALSNTERYVQCSMTVDYGGRPSVVPSTVICSAKNSYVADPSFALTMKVPGSCFTWARESRYGYYYPSGVSSSLLGHLQGALMPYLNDIKYPQSMVGAVTRGERVCTYTAERMVDEVGSGFNKRRKKEFVVNSMSSERNLFLLFGGDAPSPAPLFEIVDLKRSSSTSVLFRLHAKSETDVPFSASAFSVFRDAWLGGLDPSDYGFLYSKACADIDAGSMEILATIGELRETVSYLYERMKTIGSILRAVKRRDFSFFKKSTVSKADLWLEARYAIRPLFYDVQSILAVLRAEGKLRNTVAKKSSKSDELTTLRNISFSVDGVDYVVTGQHMTESFAQGGAYARLAMDLGLAYELGTTNIASATWELVPYSFIVDWFFSVSSFIAGLNPNPVYSVEAGFVSVSRKDFFTGTIYGTYGGKTKAFGFSDAVQRHTRIPYDNRFNISFDINLNFHKFVDLYLIFGRR